MLIDLHKPDINEAKVKLVWTRYPGSFQTWILMSFARWLTIAHTPMIIPGSHMIYIGASACLRGAVLSAAEYADLIDFRMVPIEEKDILVATWRAFYRGRYRHPECLITSLRAYSFSWAAFTHLLARIRIYIWRTFGSFSRHHSHLFADDADYERPHTWRGHAAWCIYASRNKLLNDKVVNFIGDSFPIDRSGDHMKILHDNGFRTHDLASIDDYDEYKDLKRRTKTN